MYHRRRVTWNILEYQEICIRESNVSYVIYPMWYVLRIFGILPMVNDFWIPFSAECKSSTGCPAALNVSKDWILEGLGAPNMDEVPDRLLTGAGGRCGTDTELVISDDFWGILRSTGCDPDVDIFTVKVLLFDYTTVFCQKNYFSLLPTLQ